MPIKTIYSASIDYLQILDPCGNLDRSLAEGTLTDGDVKVLYEKMVICRFFDEESFRLQRSGRMGTFPQNKGEEAVALGSARALRKGVDYIVPFYRQNPALFLHGLPMHFPLLHWMGDERGNAIPANLSMNPINVAIGSQTLHASGVAWAFKLRKEDRAVLCYVGDGATSTGDFHEGMNFASTFKLPVVFCCINNGWAISTPTAKQTGAPTFAQKALAYGMPSMQVDGNDLFAMFKSTRDAINYARSGKGPWFIEAVTYRLGDHTTADDARRYRTADEVSAHCEMDPISRTRKYLESQNLWTPADQENLEKRATAIVHDVAHLALDMEPPTTADLFDHTFAELPDELLRQKRTLRTDCLGQQPELIEPSTEQDTPDHWRVMQ